MEIKAVIRAFGNMGKQTMLLLSQFKVWREFGKDGRAFKEL